MIIVLIKRPHSLEIMFFKIAIIELKLLKPCEHCNLTGRGISYKLYYENDLIINVVDDSSANSENSSMDT